MRVFRNTWCGALCEMCECSGTPGLVLCVKRGNVCEYSGTPGSVLCAKRGNVCECSVLRASGRILCSLTALWTWRCDHFRVGHDTCCCHVHTGWHTGCVTTHAVVTCTRGGTQGASRHMLLPRAHGVVLIVRHDTCCSCTRAHGVAHRVRHDTCCCHVHTGWQTVLHVPDLRRHG